MPETPMEIVAGGSLIEAIGGIATVVLAILGLTQVLPQYMAAGATIVVGAALLLEGSAVVARYNKLARAVAGERSQRAELGGGVSAEFMGGAAGIVLGILALVNVAPLVLMAVAVIVFGGALLIGAEATQRLNTIGRELAVSAESSHVAEESVSAASGAQVLVGISAIVLGILAVLDVAPIVLILVGLLSVGASVLLSGSAITARMVNVVTRH